MHHLHVLVSLLLVPGGSLLGKEGSAWHGRWVLLQFAAGATAAVAKLLLAQLPLAPPPRRRPLLRGDIVVLARPLPTSLPAVKCRLTIFSVSVGRLLTKFEYFPEGTAGSDLVIYCVLNK